MNAARNYFLYSDGPGENPMPLPPPPRLLIEWEPRWRAFRSALGPALGSSEAPLAGECRIGAIHGRNSVLSILLHLTALLVLVSIPVHVMRSQQLLHAEDSREYQVLYYSGDELPQIAHDAGGAEAGATGRAGGRELYHPTQVIRIARGSKPVDVVADAPQLKLPRTSAPIANLLTMPAFDPGPPPAASLHARTAAVSALQPTPISAPPEVRREQIPQPLTLPAPLIKAPPESRMEISGLRLPELGTAHVAPPPVSALPHESNALAKLTLPAHVAVAPLPLVSREVSSIGIPGFGARQDIIPPPPQTSGNGSINSGALGRASKSLSALAGSATAAGTGQGTGVAQGGVTAIVVSSTPGSAIGIPGNGGPGTLAMSPQGGSQPGLGGSGGGSGIGKGNGPGSGSHGLGSGSGAAGSGPGSGATRPGASPGPGPGGTGSGYEAAALAGVTVIGGSKVIVPGFSTPSSSPSGMSRSSSDGRARPAITIIATARSGGALNTYGVFKGTKVYTIYIGTRIGMAVLQYAERVPGNRGFEEDLAPPEPLNSEFPADTKRAHVLVSCILDTSGALKNLRVMESDSNAEISGILAALEQWRFRPVLRNNQPVEVDAMLGFNVDTR